MLVPLKLVVKPQSPVNGNKKFFNRDDDLQADVTLEIYFACWYFLAWAYADEPLNLFQEEFHCACSSKARGKAAKSS